MQKIKEMEEWKEIEGFKGIYEVSDKGNIKGKERLVVHRHGGFQLIKERILKPRINTSGYPMVILCKDGVQENFLAHRLVATAFLPNSRKRAEVNHKNFNKKDNRLENLEWVSSRQNMAHYNQSKLPILKPS